MESRAGAASHRASAKLTGLQGPSLTGHGPTGIVTALIQRPADGDRGKFGCGKPPSIKGAGGRRAWTKHGRAAHIDRGGPKPTSSATSRRCRSTAAKGASLVLRRVSG